MPKPSPFDHDPIANLLFDNLARALHRRRYPGYVGSDRGGRLVNELNSDPYGVFLLDEADKAHPDVLQPFLNVFDEGWVTDRRGSKGHAQKSIFIMTTYVGQRMIADMFKEGKSYLAG